MFQVFFILLQKKVEQDKQDSFPLEKKEGKKKRENGKRYNSISITAFPLQETNNTDFRNPEVAQDSQAKMDLEGGGVVSLRPPPLTLKEAHESNMTSISLETNGGLVRSRHTKKEGKEQDLMTDSTC